MRSVLIIPDSAGILERFALGGDARQQLGPGLDERPGPFVLELSGQGIDVDAGGGELGQDLLAVAAVRG